MLVNIPWIFIIFARSHTISITTIMRNKITLSVKHFGPITNAEVTFNRITTFVGPQGSGKSTLAKLYSMFLWIEKRLERGLVTEKRVTQSMRFQKVYCGYHRLSSYFYNDTEIIFSGYAYTFTYRDKNLEILKNDNKEESKVVKVMYVPAERNFLSSIGNLSDFKNLPLALQTFKDEYDSAIQKYASGFHLPLNNVRFEYDRLNKIPWLIGDDYKVRLSDASSGFQAALPMLLVSQYLTESVASRNDGSESRLSIAEQERLNQRVKSVIENTNISPEVRNAALAVISSQFNYSGFVNVVEEPEENLYPESQKEVLYMLLRLANIEEDNRLVLTTHSPYIINYLTLAIKAGRLKDNATGNEGILGSINSIVNAGSCISAEDVNIYEMADGSARLLDMPGGLPTDNNFLNRALYDVNTMFDSLLDIEEDM